MAEYIEYLKTLGEDHFDLVAVNKAFGANDPIDLPPINPPLKNRPTKTSLDPLQRLTRLMQQVVDGT